jgi:hypothetical protein
MESRTESAVEDSSWRGSKMCGATTTYLDRLYKVDIHDFDSHCYCICLLAVIASFDLHW